MRDIIVKTAQAGEPNDRFWAACGLDELFAFTLTEAGQFLTDRMQNKGTCRYVRNHFTLNREIIRGRRCASMISTLYSRHQIFFEILMKSPKLRY